MSHAFHSKIFHADSFQDVILFEAKEQADREIERLLKNIEASRWKLVAESVKARQVCTVLQLGHNPRLLILLQPFTNFSKEACKTRHESIVSGTAKPTPESVIDPDEDIITQIKARQEMVAKIEADKIYFRKEVGRVDHKIT